MTEVLPTLHRSPRAVPAALLLRLVVLGSGVSLLPACASALHEPPLAAQLWQQQACFAHVLPPWRELSAAALAGRVVEAYEPSDRPVPQATVYARRWPSGPVLTAVTDDAGRFQFPGGTAGAYEVAACSPGWNPWRGTVTVSPAATAGDLVLPIALGQ